MGLKSLFLSISPSPPLPLCRDFHSNTQSERVLPANERTQLRWNGNPFLLDSGGADGEVDPGAWLLPYWMARWIKML